jgi:hypothetical protein
LNYPSNNDHECGEHAKGLLDENAHVPIAVEHQGHELAEKDTNQLHANDDHKRLD